MVANQDSTANVEGKALLAAIRDVPAGEPTACSAWTAHEVVAHLAAGAKEIADLIEAKLEGRSDRPTRGFEEREAPFRALGPEELMGCLVEENKRKLRAHAALTAQADPSIAFTGTNITATQLAVHSRSEAAVHRWDLVGDDDTSEHLLAQPELTAHAAWVLNAMPILNESASALGSRAVEAGFSRADVVFRAAGQPDVVLHVDPSSSRLEISEEPCEADVVLTMRPHHRLLVLWGRRPSQLDATFDGDPALRAALDLIVWPDARPWG